MKTFAWLIALYLISLSISAAPKYPFPQSVKYAYGILPSEISIDQVQACYTDFNTRLYEESGDKARIKWDTETMTVSEGIGYGMIIMVYMDNATNNTQAKFDKLWKYYNNFLDGNGLMNWKITGFSSANQMNSATDAELDVAVGLMEAYKQWGNEQYLTDAKSFIGKIMKFEVDSMGLVKPGDAWNNEKNSSYFSTGAFELFKKADTNGWNKVVTNSYSLMEKARNSTTGLIPNWCSTSGTPSGGERGQFTYDAIRIPWRLGWAYCWYGQEEAKTICSGMASWINTKTSGDPAKICDKYGLDGSVVSSYNNGTFVGCFASAGLVDAKHQTWLNAAYNRLSDSLVSVKEKYYSQSLKLLNLLLLSGNMPDFWNMPTPVSPEVARNVGTMPSAPIISLDSRRAVVSVHGTRGAFSLEIYSSAGRRLTGPVYGFAGGSRVTLPLNRPLLPGAYWVRLKTAGEVVNRLVISR
jgi:endoglucanase